jgi:hypothetical protein
MDTIPVSHAGTTMSLDMIIMIYKHNDTIQVWSTNITIKYPHWLFLLSIRADGSLVPTNSFDQTLELISMLRLEVSKARMYPVSYI